MRRYLLRSGFALLKRRYKWFCLVACVQIIFFYFSLNILDDIFSEDFPEQKPVNETQEELDSKRYLQALIKGSILSRYIVIQAF